MVQKIQDTIDEESRPFWDGLKKNELMIQQCDDCAKHIFYPRSICPHCFSENISWVQSSGRGTIYSYTTIHQAFGPFKDDVPFVAALVDLDEGVRMLTHIVGERKQIAINKRVKVTFHQMKGDLVLPYFELE